MSESEFNVGDRVLVVGGRWEGETGTICGLSAGTVSVEFDTFNSRRHRCGGAARPGHGWNYTFCTDWLEIIDDAFPDVDDLI